MSEKKELRKLADYFKSVSAPLNVSVFKELEIIFKNTNEVMIHEYGPIKNELARVTYVGPRYANVIISNGSTISLNYGSIVARAANKEDGACNLSI